MVEGLLPSVRGLWLGWTIDVREGFMTTLYRQVINCLVLYVAPFKKQTVTWLGDVEVYLIVFVMGDTH